VIASIPIVSYVRKINAESRAVGFLGHVQAAQEAFRNGSGRGAYASDLSSLTTACAGETGAVLSEGELTDAIGAGYETVLRPASDAETRGVDCHGRPTVSNYYASAQPRSADVAPRQAFAVTASAGEVYVFFDGLAPREDDMKPGGLATPLASLETFKIP
jgi:hypothetical protein